MTEREFRKEFGQYGLSDDVLSITPHSMADHPLKRYHRPSYELLLEEYRTLAPGSPARVSWLTRKKQELQGLVLVRLYSLNKYYAYTQSLVKFYVEYNIWLTLRNQARKKALASIRNQRFER